MKIVLIISCLFLMVILSCTPYTEPSVQHVYTTDTQRTHKLTGLQVEVVLGVFQFSEAVRVYIDGRHIGSSGQASGLNTFVQLPPGDHYLILTYSEEKEEFSFSLNEGQMGKLKVNRNEWMRKLNDPFNPEIKPWTFTNVASYQRLQ